jgi:DNA-directed RNA polymerase specialized sigma24 family protein
LAAVVPFERRQIVDGVDFEAYEEIVMMQQTISFWTASVITGSAADAEEAAQDAFVKLTGAAAVSHGLSRAALAASPASRAD